MVLDVVEWDAFFVLPDTGAQAVSFPNDPEPGSLPLLLANFPNPFNASTTITFEVRQPGPATRRSMNRCC